MAGFGRSPNTGNATNFRNVNTDGSSNNNNASNSYGVCLGLCKHPRRAFAASLTKYPLQWGEIRTFAEGGLVP